MFQTGFPSIRSSKLHTQRQVFVRPLGLLLSAVSLARLPAGAVWIRDDGQ